MSHKKIDTEQGHWILAKMGKKVLRPGGRELTEKLVAGLRISNSDNLVEFAPGIGVTAEMIWDKSPQGYTGIEINEEATTRLRKKLRKKAGYENYKICNTSATTTCLEDNVADKVIGEAMLTMMSEHRKLEIVGEAYRILKPGGRYAIHELGLQPDNLDPQIKKDIQNKLAESIHVNARPLTLKEWTRLLEKEGFTIKQTFDSPMLLLDPKRMIADEGAVGAAKIKANLMRHPDLKKRVEGMRKTFKAHQENLIAYGIIAEK